MREKVILITGGAGGIGRETAQLFLNKGAEVVLVDINKDALENAKSALNADQEYILVVQADVTNEEDVKNYVKQTVDAFGKIDVGVFLGMKHYKRELALASSA